VVDLSVVIPVFNEEESLPSLLAVRWMKSRLLRYEVTEDLGGDLSRE